jgi:predicted dehydrogenase
MSRGRRAFVWAWSAAGAMPLSARSTGSPRGSTTSTNWWRDAFPQRPEKALASAADLGVPRAYASFAEMAAREARRKDGIEAVAIVTPNHMHAPVAMQFLKRRHPCDLRQAADRDPGRGEAAGQGGRGQRRVFALTHNYTGYPMVRQARPWCRPATWARSAWCRWNTRRTGWPNRMEQTGHKQADWRTDPAAPGRAAVDRRHRDPCLQPGGLCHRADTSGTGRRPDRFVPGRRVDDNAHVMLRYQGGARGMLWCSRWRPAMKTPCACGSMAPRAGSNGRRRTRTTCGSRPWASRG